MASAIFLTFLLLSAPEFTLCHTNAFYLLLCNIMYKVNNMFWSLTSQTDFRDQQWEHTGSDHLPELTVQYLNSDSIAKKTFYIQKCNKCFK